MSKAIRPRQMLSIVIRGGLRFARYPPSNVTRTAAVLRLAPIRNSIFRKPDGRLHRPWIWALTVGGLLTIAHFVCPASSGRRIRPDSVTNIAQVILSRESPRQEIPQLIAPLAPTSNPEIELNGHQA